MRSTFTTLAFHVDGPKSPFLLSPSRNVLVGVGVEFQPSVGNFKTVGPRDQDYLVYCRSTLMGNLQLASNGSCSRWGCCKASFPVELPLSGFSLSPLPARSSLWLTNPCSSAMVVEDSWYNFSSADLYGNTTTDKFPRGVPYVIDFAIRNDRCPAEGQQPPLDYACVSSNSSCADVANGYICKCLEHYEGNPYIPNGCQGNNIYTRTSSVLIAPTNLLTKLNI
jgi:hypothetical protein